MNTDRATFSSVKQKVIDVLVEQLYIEESDIQDNDTLAGLGADSLDYVEITMHFEEVRPDYGH